MIVRTLYRCIAFGGAVLTSVSTATLDGVHLSDLFCSGQIFVHVEDCSRPEQIASYTLWHEDEARCTHIH